MKGAMAMITRVVLATGMLAAMAPVLALAQVEGGSFDVLASVMQTHVTEINANDVLDANRKQAQQFREKAIAGWWEFMQANSKAGPGEYCAATFLRAKRQPIPGKDDALREGIAVTLFGPGGNYRGALLAFSPLGADAAAAFPKAANGAPVRVTLTQGDITPVTLNAIYVQTGPKSPPLLAFAVPSIEELMGGMEDTWRFDVSQEGKSIASIEWHDGLMARNQLRQCLAGKPYGNQG
ncbi:MAG: hypothetical protein LCH70_00910 [Proteobacteria bacterium]|nr:hypothetical protein [Pseudomonadota bacterium]